MQVSGQEFSTDLIERIQAAAASDGMTRGRLARLTCEWLNWRHHDGRLKEMNCRAALAKLHQRGVIQLPEPKPIRFGSEKRVEKVDWPTIKASLPELGKLEVVPVKDKALSRVWRQMMKEHHSLGDGPLCGAQMRYLVRNREGWLAGLSFSAAAWRLTVRDEWIGWDDAARSQGLSKIVCNSRFLILPSVQVKHLASHILGLVLQRLPWDWQMRYGEEPVLVETFVDPRRWTGTCYRAANFIELGFTEGRGRQDRKNEFAAGQKKVLVYALREDWQAVLCGGREPVNPHAAKTGLNPPVLDWAREEFGGCELGDSRLTERLKIIARDFFAQPTANLPQACGSRAKTKAAYRFFDHEATSLKAILEPHYAATKRRIGREAVVLAVQDTSTINYAAGDTETEGLGPIAKRADGAQGLILHSTLAFSVSGVPLGLLDTQCWARDPEQLGKKFRKKREKLPIEEKESFKWLKSYRAVSDVQYRCPDVMLVSVGDREADFYELFAEADKKPDGPHLLVRAAHDRRVQNEESYLWEVLENQPLAGTQVLQVPRTKNGPKRKAHLEVRFAKISLGVPRDKRRAKGGKELKDIEVWAVLAQEKNGSGKDQLEWLLLTTLPVENFEEAVEKLNWYTKRWGIEVYHKVLKSGCRIEDRQLCTAERLETCLAIDMVVAWRVYYISQLGREMPNASCEICFSEAEWKVLSFYPTKETTLPSKPPTLREAIRLAASLGGFLGRKCDGEPGTETLWRGLQRLGDIAGLYDFLSSNPRLFGAPFQVIMSEYIKSNPALVHTPRLRMFRKGNYG